jgi:hypothetical protein
VISPPLLTMNPTADADEIAKAYADDPAAAAAEFDAEFRTDLQAFIAREVVDACTVIGRHELPPATGTDYVGFADPPPAVRTRSPSPLRTARCATAR